MVFIADRNYGNYGNLTLIRTHYYDDECIATAFGGHNYKTTVLLTRSLS
jgi:hypothetical protein